MALKFPDILEHNNPNNPLVASSQFKGVAVAIGQLSDTGSIPTNKRDIGTIIFVSSSQEYYAFTSDDVSNWDTPSNWKEISIGATSEFTSAGISGSWQSQNFLTTSPFTSAGITGSAQSLLSASLGEVVNITASGDISSSGTGSFSYVELTSGARIDGTLRTYTDSEGNSRNVGLHVDQDISASGFVGEFFEISSSIVFNSSSTQFGDNLNDTHEFTGSVFVTASSFTFNGLDILTTNDISSHVLNSETASFAITSSDVLFANITSSGNISGSSVSTGSFGHIKIDGTNIKTFISSSVAADGFSGGGGGSGISDIVNDTTPQLGGNLDLNSNNITGIGSINITGNAVISGSINVSGSIIPDSNAKYSLGGKGNKFKSIFAEDTFFGDMNLSNEDREPNEVDGTQGSWTIQEGDEDLFLINRKNGKKYKFMLKEVK